MSKEAQCTTCTMHMYTTHKKMGGSCKGKYHAHGVPVEGLQAIVIPGGNAPKAGVLLQQHCSGGKEMQEVWAEQHVVLHNDDMAVALLQEGLVQSPFVVLGQPSVPWLQGRTTCRLCWRP